MIALAYRYAESDCEGEAPKDLQLLWAIQKYGAQAIYGRTLGRMEIKRMTASENILNLFKERSKSVNWAAWSTSNPAEARMLEAAAQIAREYEQ